MEMPKSRMETLFPDAQWGPLFREYAALNSHDTKVEFFNKKMGNGIASVGAALNNPIVGALLKEGQGHIDSIFDASVNATGVEKGLVNTPSRITSSFNRFLWANNEGVSKAMVVKAEQVKAHGGGKFRAVFMDQPTREKGCGGVHLEGVVIFDDPKDGEPLTVSVALAYDKDAMPLAHKYVTTRFGVKDLGVVAGVSNYSKLLSQGQLLVGPRNIILPLRKKDWPLSIVETLGHQKAGHEDAYCGLDYGRVAFPATVFAEWDLTRDQVSKMLQLERLHELAVEQGKLLGAIHYPCGSCGALVAEWFASALDDGSLTREDCSAIHLDDLILKMLKIAPRVYWAKEDGKGAQLKLDDVTETILANYELISNDTALDRMGRMLNSPEIFKAFIPDFSSWGNHYTMQNVEHRDARARYLALEGLRVLVDELKAMAFGEDTPFMLG